MVGVEGSFPFLLKKAKNATINGVIFSMGDMTWSAGSGVVNGALLTQTNFNATGTATLVYDREIVRRIRQSYGSFVRVPGSWRIAV